MVLVKNIWLDLGSPTYKIENHCVFYHLIDDELKENDLLMVAKID